MLKLERKIRFALPSLCDAVLLHWSFERGVEDATSYLEGLELGLDLQILFDLCTASIENEAEAFESSDYVKGVIHTLAGWSETSSKDKD